MIKLLSACLLVCSVISMNMFNLHELTKQNGAMCMDGSPYGVNIYEPDPQDFKVIANKLLIFFEPVPQGWCFQTSDSTSLEHCFKFLTEDNFKDFSSSDNWPSNFFFWDGIFSFTGGGYFSNWPKVFLRNCDGGSYLGNAGPISFKHQRMYFRGSQNVKEAISYLNKKNFLKDREEVVIAGTFNGGVAAQLWSDYIKSQTNGKVKLLLDSSLYLNSMNYKLNQSVIEDRMRQVQKYTVESS